MRGKNEAILVPLQIIEYPEWADRGGHILPYVIYRANLVTENIKEEYSILFKYRHSQYL